MGDDDVFSVGWNLPASGGTIDPGPGGPGGLVGTVWEREPCFFPVVCPLCKEELKADEEAILIDELEPDSSCRGWFIINAVLGHAKCERQLTRWWAL